MPKEKGYAKRNVTGKTRSQESVEQAKSDQQNSRPQRDPAYWP
jgi:hypothetical protein